jgi:hypothetical protein
MALLFSKAWKDQRTRNHKEAQSLINQYGDKAPEILENRLKTSTQDARDHRHWKRVQAQLNSITSAQ